MRQYLFLLMAVVGITNLSYASFPVVEKANQQTTEMASVELDEVASTIVAGTTFKFGGFILGLLLGLIGVGLAYIFSDDKDFIRSAWYGLGTWMILWLLLMAAA